MAIHHSIREQKPDDQVYDRSLTGWPTGVMGRLHLKLGALTRHGAFHMKIGISNKPTRRWREAYRKNGWVQMHLVYRSASHVHVCELEKLMIDRLGAGLMESAPWYYNEVAGGGGPKPRQGPFYLYVVTAPKFARITRGINRTP